MRRRIWACNENDKETAREIGWSLFQSEIASVLRRGGVIRYISEPGAVIMVTYAENARDASFHFTTYPDHVNKEQEI